MGLFDRALATVLPVVPRAVVQRVSAPYIAGPTLADAIAVVTSLNADGKRATVDVLGEEIHSAEEARAIAAAYADALAAIDESSLDANVSVKLTGLGLKLDLELCHELLDALVQDAASRGSFVRIDMEDATCVDDTLSLYRTLRGNGHDNVGIVLQAYLKRTLHDIADLRELRPSVRLCKGIYIEPASIAFRDADVVRRSFVAALDALLEGARASRSRPTTRRCSPRRSIGLRGSAPTATSSRCCSVCARAARPSSCTRVIHCGSTCPTGSGGTSTPCGGSRRTRTWPESSRGPPWPVRSAGPETQEAPARRGAGASAVSGAGRLPRASGAGLSECRSAIMHSRSESELRAASVRG